MCLSQPLWLCGPLNGLYSSCMTNFYLKPPPPPPPPPPRSEKDMIIIKSVSPFPYIQQWTYSSANTTPDKNSMQGQVSLVLGKLRGDKNHKVGRVDGNADVVRACGGLKAERCPSRLREVCRLQWFGWKGIPKLIANRLLMDYPYNRVMLYRSYQENILPVTAIYITTVGAICKELGSNLVVFASTLTSVHQIQ